MTDWLRELDADNSKTTIKSKEESFSYSPKNGREDLRRKCCFWYYKLNPEVSGYTEMGLLTDDQAEAQRQLVKIYGRPVNDLHRKYRND